MSFVFALVLLGCADDGTACETLSQPAARYTTQALCEAGVDTALESDVALQADYPTVIARCRRMSATTKIARAS